MRVDQMNKVLKGIVFSAIAVAAFSVTSFAQSVKRTPFDVTNYVIDATLAPRERKITATTDVTFSPLEDTRTISFELNGSLKIDTITRVNAAVTLPSMAARATPKTASPTAQITFVQDQAGASDLGPSVRIDLGENVTANTPVTLRFKYSGVFETPAGGPLLNKRLAYVGTDFGYLMYAARWFPFHDYAADRATADISITVPAGTQMVGYSDQPVTATGGKYRFVQSKPGLVGNIAYGKYVSRTLTMNGFEMVFNSRPGTEQVVQGYAEILGKALDNYTKRFGAADFGKRIIVTQIDDESLEFYSTTGSIMIATRQFEEARDITKERLQREAAYQWWGQTVALKAFDDAWLSQGLAEYCAFSLRESEASTDGVDAIRRELLERALTYEPTASLVRAPSMLDDQSTAYQYLMYAKGAFVFKLLRDTMGEAKFDQMMRQFLQQYRGKNASIDDFEKLASSVNGDNLRYFFARWVEGTGVPEFEADYQILRTRGGKFIARGTVKQNYDNLRLPLEVQLRSEGEAGIKTEKLFVEDSSVDFNIESTGKPLGVAIDPGYKLLRISPDLRVSSIARRGIEQFKEGNYVEAQQQFEAALKLDKSNSWIYYHLGLLFLEQRNYDLAIDNFKAALGGNLNPQWLSVWSNIKMGNAYDAKGDRTRATAAYGRAQKIGDDFDGAQAAAKQYQGTPYDPKARTANKQ
ncbi:MAG TPA: M1 family aminopeptidase [Pyrinomonadaceae bacterium]|nr:M1 family aminopeptidase [Pyrinomonadaceae bacterium]